MAIEPRGDNRGSAGDARARRAQMAGTSLDIVQRMQALPTPRVLVADDQPDIIAALRLVLKSAGFEAGSAASVDEIRRQVQAHDYDLLLMDLNYARDTTSGAEGLALIGEVHGVRPRLPIIAMTGWANVDTAVEAMRRGARGLRPQALGQRCARRDRQTGSGRRTRRLPRRAHATREWTEARAIQRALLPEALPAVPVRSWPRAGSRPPASAATTTTPCRWTAARSRSASPTSAARGCRRAADVERAGHGASLHGERHATGRRRRGDQPRALPPRLARPLRHALRRALRPAQRRAPLRQRRPQPADPGAARRPDRAAVARAGSSPGRSTRPVTTAARPRWCPAIASACSLTACRKRCRRRVRSSATPDRRGRARARALDASAIVDLVFAEVAGAVGGPCQDDATAVVLAID